MVEIQNVKFKMLQRQQLKAWKWFRQSVVELTEHLRGRLCEIACPPKQLTICVGKERGESKCVVLLGEQRRVDFVFAHVLSAEFYV